LAILAVKSRTQLVPYLPQITPALVHILKTSDPPARRNVVKDVGTIVHVMARHMRVHLQCLLDVLLELWFPPAVPVRACSGLFF
jgi:hypothetical protein